jgi:hypothetical protein
MARGLASSASLICAAVRSARTFVRLAAVVALTGIGHAAPPQSLGTWTGPYDWGCQLDIGPSCVALAELSHAALISTGAYQGQVLMWR